MPPPAYLKQPSLRFSWRDPALNLGELIFETVHAALVDSGTDIAEVDSVVLAAHDMVDGRSLTSMIHAPTAGAYLKEEIRVSEDGAAALAIALAQIQAGEARTCLVAGWGRASEGQPERISNSLFDPFFSAPLGMTELAVSGLRASAALAAHPDYGHRRTDARRRRREQAGRRRAAELPPPGPVPAPLRPDEAATPADVVCAMVLTTETTDVRVPAIVTSTDPYWPGDRDLLGLPALRRASRDALELAGRSVDDVTVFELDGATLFDEALAVEAVGAAAPGDGMGSLADDDRINASGGYALGACAPAMGLVRIAAAADALRGAGSPGGGVALASGSSCVAGQVQIAAVLEHA
ncbi:MAG: hypothetical protein AB7G37_13335 [Solirubrobacteraceae bacterium]